MEFSDFGQYSSLGIYSDYVGFLVRDSSLDDSLDLVLDDECFFSSKLENGSVIYSPSFNVDGLSLMPVFIEELVFAWSCKETLLGSVD